MKKRLLIVLFVLLGVSTLGACGKGEENTEEESVQIIDNTEAESTQIIEKKEEIAGGVFDVQFEFVYTKEDNGDTGEYATITGVDEDGNTVWEHITEKYQAGQFSYIFNIGIDDDYYYYVENSVIIVRNVSDGTVVWENTDGLSWGCSVFDNDGTLYFCGGDGEVGRSFLAIDKNGNTLAYIDNLHPDYGNPWTMEYMGDYIEVTMDYDGNDSDGKSGVFHINLDDFSYELVK